jgi:DNA polymerase III sliding clamp (beta) subunit (PCNA family)
LEKSILKELISKITTIISEKAHIDVIRGALVKIYEEEMVIAGTDEDVRRVIIIEKHIPLKIKTNSKNKFLIWEGIIPKQGLVEVQKVLLKSDNSRAVRIETNSKRITFECDGEKINIKLIEGIAPQYKAAFPEEGQGKKEIVIQKKDALEKIETISSILKEMNFLKDLQQDLQQIKEVISWIPTDKIVIKFYFTFTLCILLEATLVDGKLYYLHLIKKI